jgi:uncharacterized membrane protein
MAEVVLCLILFAACALHVRWRFQMAKEGSPEAALAKEAST